MERNQYGELVLDNIKYTKTDKIYKGREHKYSIVLEDGTELIMFPLTNSTRGTVEVNNDVPDTVVTNKENALVFTIGGGGTIINEHIYNPSLDTKKAFNLYLPNKQGGFDINPEYYAKYKKMINELVIMELAKQFGIPTATYDLAFIEGRHELMSVNFLKANERLITFDQLTYDQRGNISEYLKSLNLQNNQAEQLEEMFHKMELFSYFAGDIDYGPGNYGLITDGNYYRIAPMFDKLDAGVKQTIPLSQNSLDKIGNDRFLQYLQELFKELNIEAVYDKLRELGIVIPDELILEQIEVFNHNYEKLEKQLSMQNTDKQLGKN